MVWIDVGNSDVGPFVLRSSGVDPPISWTAVRRHLHERLPEYMVPFSFEAVDELPLLPGGKIDRRRLSARPAARPPIGTRHDGPARVASRWGVELSLEDIFDNPTVTALASAIDRRLRDAGSH